MSEDKKELTLEERDAIKTRIRELLAAPIAPLHAIDQTLVDQMQEAMRWQSERLIQFERVTRHILDRIKAEKEVRKIMGCGSQSFAVLTEAYASYRYPRLDDLRELLIPGSAEIHREN